MYPPYIFYEGKKYHLQKMLSIKNNYDDRFHDEYLDPDVTVAEGVEPHKIEVRYSPSDWARQCPDVSPCSPHQGRIVRKRIL
jgi:hypothetical protein